MGEERVGAKVLRVRKRVRTSQGREPKSANERRECALKLLPLLPRAGWHIKSFMKSWSVFLQKKVISFF
jgi:hypothetical protein